MRLDYFRKDAIRSKMRRFTVSVTVLSALVTCCTLFVAFGTPRQASATGSQTIQTTSLIVIVSVVLAFIAFLALMMLRLHKIQKWLETEIVLSGTTLMITHPNGKRHAFPLSEVSFEVPQGWFSANVPVMKEAIRISYADRHAIIFPQLLSHFDSLRSSLDAAGRSLVEIRPDLIRDTQTTVMGSRIR